MTIGARPLSALPLMGLGSKQYSVSASGGVLTGGVAVFYGSQSEDDIEYGQTGGTGTPSQVFTNTASGGALTGGQETDIQSNVPLIGGGVLSGGDAFKHYVSALSAGAYAFDSYWDDLGVPLSLHELDTGQYWTAGSDWTITGSGGSSSTGWSFSTVNIGQSNVSVSVEVSLQSTDNEAGIVFRYLNGNNAWIATLDIQNQALKLWEVGAGTFMLKAFSLMTITAGTTYLLEVFAEGSTIIAQVGALSISVTSTDFQTQTTVGTAVDDSPGAVFNQFDSTSPINDLWASGGALTGGSAVNQVDFAPPTSGGALTGGQETTPPFYDYNGSGGVLTGGSSQQKITIEASGGVLTGGYGFETYNQQASGGTLSGGAAVNQVAFHPPTSGGVLTGGAAGNQSSDETSGGGSLVPYFTGASADGGTQTSQAASLGNYRSSTEASRVGFLEGANCIPNVDTLTTSHQLGTGSLIVLGTDQVAYTAPGGISGTPVTLAVGFPNVVTDGANSSQWVKVERTSTDDLAGWTTLEFTEQFGNVFGAGNATTAGESTYRAVIFRNQSILPCNAITLWVNPLSAQTSVYLGLPASGAGTIYGTPDAFADWDYSGFAQVTNNGTIKEVVYYNSRTSTTLSVPSLGRGLLGTSVYLSQPGDKVQQVPPVLIGLEYCQPFNGGGIQSIANDSTTPNLVTFTSQPINVGVMNVNEQFGIWINRQLPAGITATPVMMVSLGISFVQNGVTYTDSLNGMFRVSNSSLVRYELGVGVNSNAASVVETFTSLPHTTTYTLSPSNTYSVAVNQRNAFNLASDDAQSTTFVINGSGQQVQPPPSSPVDTSVVALPSGAFSITSRYLFPSDPSAAQANAFHIYVRFDGTNPNPGTDTPILYTVPLNSERDPTDSGGYYALAYTTATHSVPTTCKAIVRAFRVVDSTESTNSDIESATSQTTVFVPTTLKGIMRQVAELLS
jgi:hypothetical protein